MPNILDYLAWRGDLTLQERPFNDVDNLLFAEISYLEFRNVLDDEPDFFEKTLEKATARYFELHPITDMGVLVPDVIPELARKMGESARFGGTLVDGYVNVIDEDTSLQFSAVTFLLPDQTLYVAFRGTDDTIVGWKEDFNMSFLPEVPAQKQAVDYLKKVAEKFPDLQIRVGGHSKGGNLAVYSAVFCGADVQDRIIHVYCNDGPGFRDRIQNSPEHARVAGKIVTILPETSVIGMLLEHEDHFTVVSSDASGLWQHDGFSWQVIGDRFDTLPELTAEGKFLDRTIDTFVHDLDEDARIGFVNTLFDVLCCTDAGTLTELKNGGFKTATAMLKRMSGLSKEEKKSLVSCIRLLLSAGAKTAEQELREKREKAQSSKNFPQYQA